jgi:energy-coupling factor transport system permease protein
MTSLKLFNAIVFAYTISRLMPISQISEGFYYLFYPLKLFKVNIKNLSLIISIAITFIPIMSNEASEIKKSLISKGFNFNIKNVFTKPHIFLVTYFNNLFNKVDELEKALLMKGYE